MKQITVKDEYGNKYTLEYTRESVIQLEKAGFKRDGDMPMTSVKLLFQGAFLVNHKTMKADLIDKIFDRQKNKQALVEKLMEMYEEPFETLMEEPKEQGEDWEVNW